MSADTPPVDPVIDAQDAREIIEVESPPLGLLGLASHFAVDEANETEVESEGGEP